jgi:hypothetical protein
VMNSRRFIRLPHRRGASTDHGASTIEGTQSRGARCFCLLRLLRSFIPCPVPVTSLGNADRGVYLPLAREHTMAFKWTKASRAKLSRSQKARWKKRKRQQHRKPAKRPSR